MATNGRDDISHHTPTQHTKNRTLSVLHVSVSGGCSVLMATHKTLLVMYQLNNSFVVSNGPNVSRNGIDYFGYDFTTDFYIFLSLLIFGLPGNVLIILVMRKLASATATLTIYMTIFDTLAIATKTLFSGLDIVLEYSKEEVYKREIIFVFIGFFVGSGNWTLVLICTERFISVVYPLQRQRIVTSRRVHMVVVVVNLMALLYGILTVSIRSYLQKATEEYYFINHLITINVFILVIPLIIITVLTISVIVKLKFSLQIEIALTQSVGGVRQNIERTLMYLMISSAILFFILNCPMAIFLPLRYNLDLADTEGVVINEYCFLLLLNASHVFNFYIYITCCKGFRKLTLKMLKNCWY